MNEIREGRKNNKGFSLIELLVAVALFAIIVIPVMSTFITSMRLNQKSRKMMIAYDLGQTIMEDISDKNYEVLKGGLQNVGTVELSGSVSLNSLSGNYSTSVNGMTIATTSANSITIFPNASDKTKMKIKGGAADIVCAKLVSENKADAISANKAFYAMCVSDLPGGTTNLDKKIISKVEDEAGFLGYTNVERGGYHFDVMIQFIPMRTDKKDAYFTYEAMLYIYEFDDQGTTADRVGSDPIITMMSGIANKNG